jgi:predicted DNA-binding transcriptional regulator AlpA
MRGGKLRGTEGTDVKMLESQRPPAYVSKSTLARELDCSESTVDSLVDRGSLPKPIRLSSGCVRWIWDDVVIALHSLKGAESSAGDPYLKGVQNAPQIG